MILTLPSFSYRQTDVEHIKSRIIYPPSLLSAHIFGRLKCFLWLNDVISRNVLSLKCHISEFVFLWNVLSMKCPVYEMSFLWDVLSMILFSMKCLSIKWTERSFSKKTNEIDEKFTRILRMKWSNFFLNDLKKRTK